MNRYEQLKGVASDFKIYVKKVGDLETAYSMDHSAGTYLFDLAGRICLYSRYGHGIQLLYEDIRQLLVGK